MSELSRACFKRDNWHCRSCHSTFGLQPHHIKFRSQGGADTLDNLVTLCWICHRDVHDGFLEVKWEREITMEGRIVVWFRRKRGWKP
jgi:hypothetical protein